MRRSGGRSLARDRGDDVRSRVSVHDANDRDRANGHDHDRAYVNGGVSPYGKCTLLMAICR